MNVWLVWLPYVMAYQPSCAICCQNRPCRRTAVILSIPSLEGEDRGFILFPRVNVRKKKRHTANEFRTRSLRYRTSARYVTGILDIYTQMKVVTFVVFSSLRQATARPEKYSSPTVLQPLSNPLSHLKTFTHDNTLSVWIKICWLYRSSVNSYK